MSPNPMSPNPMSPNPIETYRRAQGCLEAVLAAVPDSWEAPSMCAAWTVRDVAGHLVWGQEQLRHWATGQAYACTTGAPGAPHPGEMAGPDPVATWQTARTAADEALTEEALARTVQLPALGEIPLTAMLTLLVTDQLAHAWDIGHAVGLDVKVDPELIPASLAWAHEHAIRVPGFFGPELTPPPGADMQTRWLAYLGRLSP